MRHSGHSQSRHGLVSSQGRKSSCSDHTDTKEKHKRGNMKCIITLGILLPILAAIIGVAAWAVSGDSDRHQSSHNQAHRPSFQRGHISRFHNDLVPVLEERNDLLYDHGKVPIGGAVSKDILGGDTVHEDDVNQVHLTGDDYSAKPSASSSNDHPKDDPLYVVHYVPQDMKSQMSTPSSAPSKPPEDILSKILSSSKGANKGTPQFVVFAPLPGEMDEKDSRKSFDPDYDYDENEPQARATAKRVRVKKRRKGRKNANFQDDFEHSDEPKHGNGGSNRPGSSVLPRTGQFYSDSRPSGDQSDFQAYDDDQFNNRHIGPYQPIPYNQQNHMAMNQMPMQQQHQQNQMGGKKMTCCFQNQGQQNQAQGHGQQMQMMPMRPMQPMQPMQQQPQQPTQDADRFGQMQQPGITISLGNGNGLPLGPLGILRQILRPTVDLKKKMFFGVQLENGFGFGQNRGNDGNQGGGGGQQGGAGGQQGGGGGGTAQMGPPMMTFHTG